MQNNIRKTELQMLTKMMLQETLERIREFKQAKAMFDSAESRPTAAEDMPYRDAAKQVMAELEAADHIGMLTRLAHMIQAIADDVDQSACDDDDMERFAEKIDEIKNVARESFNLVQRMLPKIKEARLSAAATTERRTARGPQRRTEYSLLRELYRRSPPSAN